MAEIRNEAKEKEKATFLKARGAKYAAIPERKHTSRLAARHVTQRADYATLPEEEHTANLTARRADYAAMPKVPTAPEIALLKDVNPPLGAHRSIKCNVRGQQREDSRDYLTTIQD